MNKLQSFFAGFCIAVGVILICCILAWLFTRCQSFNQTPIQTVSVTQLTNNAESEWRYWKTNVPKPIVQVSEYPKVEPELPREFLSTNTLPTNELLILNEILVQDQLLIWLNQLDK